jgi:hypothetical protein
MQTTLFLTKASQPHQGTNNTESANCIDPKLLEFCKTNHFAPAVRHIHYFMAHSGDMQFNRYIVRVPQQYLCGDPKAPRTDRQQNVVMNPVGLGTKNECAGEAPQQFRSQSILVHPFFLQSFSLTTPIPVQSSNESPLNGWEISKFPRAIICLYWAV